MGITLFLFNHFFSYRYNLEKDLASTPDIGTMAFLPYARVVPMHLIIFIGLQFGMGSKIELFFFLLLKSGADLLMHVIQHGNWNEAKRLKPPALSEVEPVFQKMRAKKSARKHEQQQPATKRITLKERLKRWFLLGWVAFLVLIVIGILVMKEFNI